ncbi:hypothetical protein F5I97DRAFT_686784 [Phlebopus sp. FC_14]|nr:hypothetical protein F5I97DRAFT_686784 [Phlebopus sp. FC_14]
MHENTKSALLRARKQDGCSAAHRCLFVTEVTDIIFECIREWDEYYPPDYFQPSLDRKRIGKATLASLARTCRAFHEPALDALWMELDLLDPLVQLLPRWMWTKKCCSFVMRCFMKEKHWLTFRKYASRVKSVRGPCWNVPAPVQCNIMRTLAKFPKASLPLLPSLREIVWSLLKMSYVIYPAISLLKYLVGPGVTKISLIMPCWSFPTSLSKRAFLANLSNMCPNVTSFTVFFPYWCYKVPSQEMGTIINGWTKLRTLRTCPLPQSVMDQLANRRSLESLSIELNGSTLPPYVGRFSKTLHHFSLAGFSASLCTGYLENIQCSPESCSLRIGADDSTLGDITELFRALPVHLDKTTLRSIVVELTGSYCRWTTPSSEPPCLNINLITPFLMFRSLTKVDLDVFSSAGLDDKAFDVMARTWPNLRTLALGTCDMYWDKPRATIKALLSLLIHCPNLEFLHLVFDGSIPLPSEIPCDIQNNHITELQVGHSLIGDVNVIASYFIQLMPQLEKIISAKGLRDTIGKWAAVQKMLQKSSVYSKCIGTD